ESYAEWTRCVRRRAAQTGVEALSGAAIWPGDVGSEWGVAGAARRCRPAGVSLARGRAWACRDNGARCRVAPMAAVGVGVASHDGGRWLVVVRPLARAIVQCGDQPCSAVVVRPQARVAE